jgi:hypothetical protein
MYVWMYTYYMHTCVYIDKITHDIRSQTISTRNPNLGHILRRKRICWSNIHRNAAHVRKTKLLFSEYLTFLDIQTGSTSIFVCLGESSWSAKRGWDNHQLALEMHCTFHDIQSWCMVCRVASSFAPHLALLNLWEDARCLQKGLWINTDTCVKGKWEIENPERWSMVQPGTVQRNMIDLIDDHIRNDSYRVPATNRDLIYPESSMLRCCDSHF